MTPRSPDCGPAVDGDQGLARVRLGLGSAGQGPIESQGEARARQSKISLGPMQVFLQTCLPLNHTLLPFANRANLLDQRLEGVRDVGRLEPGRRFTSRLGHAALPWARPSAISQAR